MLAIASGCLLWGERNHTSLSGTRRGRLASSRVRCEVRGRVRACAKGAALMPAILPYRGSAPCGARSAPGGIRKSQIWDRAQKHAGDATIDGQPMYVPKKLSYIPSKLRRSSESTVVLIISTSELRHPVLAIITGFQTTKNDFISLQIRRCSLHSGASRRAQFPELSSSISILIFFINFLFKFRLIMRGLTKGCENLSSALSEFFLYANKFPRCCMRG